MTPWQGWAPASVSAETAGPKHTVGTVISMCDWKRTLATSTPRQHPKSCPCPPSEASISPCRRCHSFPVANRDSPFSQQTPPAKVSCQCVSPCFRRIRTAAPLLPHGRRNSSHVYAPRSNQGCSPGSGCQSCRRTTGPSAARQRRHHPSAILRPRQRAEENGSAGRLRPALLSARFRRAASPSGHHRRGHPFWRCRRSASQLRPVPFRISCPWWGECRKSRQLRQPGGLPGKRVGEEVSQRHEISAGLLQAAAAHLRDGSAFSAGLDAPPGCVPGGALW